MNKAELIDAMAQQLGCSKVEAGRAVAAFTEVVSTHLAQGDKVALTGFGVFEPVARQARMVRNPRTGERSEAPATTVPRFRAGAELKTAVAAAHARPAQTTTKAAAAKAPAAKSAAKAPAKKAAAKKTAASK